MNISATNYSQITRQVGFGNEDIEIERKEVSIEDAERIIKLSEQLNDSFENIEQPKMKSAGGVLASVLGAGLATFVVGKCAATKVMTAFPSLPEKFTNVMRKGANVVRDYADDVANGVKLTKGGKYSQTVAKNIGKAEAFAREQFIKYRDKLGLEGLLTNAVGVASIATIAPEVIKVDGNEDGISDIAQKNISAYKNALNSVGIVSELVSSLS